jgi:carbon starvation protein CstA
MNNEVTEAEARLALSSIEQRRQQVIAEIDVPPWYWISVAGGWVVLGVLADYGPAWATLAGTVVFGAVHSAVAPRVLSGRHASPHLSVHSDLVSRRVPVLVIGFLVLMTIVTAAFALIANADRARHPALLASVVVAALVLIGGPRLMDTVRGRAEKRLDAS